jgi:hypothetical protein
MKEASTAFHMQGGKNVTRGAATQIAGELFAFGDFPRSLLKRQREAGSVVVNPYTPPHPTVIPTNRVLGDEIFSNNLVAYEQL